MISLARADGAVKDILETVTHGARGDIMDSYITLPWANVCAEVARLRVQLIEGKTSPTPRRAERVPPAIPAGSANTQR